MKGCGLAHHRGGHHDEHRGEHPVPQRRPHHEIDHVMWDRVETIGAETHEADGNGGATTNCSNPSGSAVIPMAHGRGPESTHRPRSGQHG